MGYIYDIYISRDFTKHAGATLEIQCAAYAVSLTGKIEFKWKLDGSNIMPTHASRIQLSYSRISNVQYSSMVTIRDIKEKDGGTFT